MLSGELIRECRGARQCRGGAGPGDTALKHPTAIGSQQCIGVTAPSGAPSHELSTCLHTFPTEKWLLGSSSSSFAARGVCFPGKTRVWKSLALFLWKITFKKGLFQTLNGHGYCCFKYKNKAPIAHLSLWHSVCKHSGGEEKAGALKGGAVTKKLICGHENEN